jgi:hypothetical protein
MKFKLQKVIKNSWFNFSLLLFVALILRLSLVNVFYHLDMLSNAYWGEWIYKYGAKGFYDNNVWVYSWPTQPPLINLVYAFGYWIYITSNELFVNFSHIIVQYHLAPGKMIWYFDFVKWYNDAQYTESYLKLGLFISIKFIAIVADLLIALVIFLMLKKENLKKAIIISAIFLISPFSFYVSALWGQTDGQSFLFLLLSIAALLKKRFFILAPFLFMVSASLKPTSLMFIPLFAWIYFRQKEKWWKYVGGIILALIGFIASVAVFTDKNLYQFIVHDLTNKIFFKSGFRVSTNSFNFWHILTGNEPKEHFMTYLFLPSYYWGWFFFILTNIIGFNISREKTQKAFLSAFAVVGLGVWLFMINMLERYFYAGVVFALMTSIYYPKVLRVWIPLSIIFWLNLYHGWWVPREWDFIRRALIWNNHTLTRILSAFNVGLFFGYLYLLKLNFLKLLLAFAKKHTKFLK